MKLESKAEQYQKGKNIQSSEVDEAIDLLKKYESLMNDFGKDDPRKAEIIEKDYKEIDEAALAFLKRQKTENPIEIHLANFKLLASIENDKSVVKQLKTHIATFELLLEIGIAA